MCGIVGFSGDSQASQIILDTLKRLEYRGYDSAGIATIDGERLSVSRAVGKLVNLDTQLASAPQKGTIGIGHTRWATHGGVTEDNAHPHISGDRVAIVHNGIIENYADIKQRLTDSGCQFASDTDSEVLAHLIAEAEDKGLTLAEILS